MWTLLFIIFKSASKLFLFQVFYYIVIDYINSKERKFLILPYIMKNNILKHHLKSKCF